MGGTPCLFLISFIVARRGNWNSVDNNQTVFTYCKWDLMNFQLTKWPIFSTGCYDVILILQFHIGLPLHH